MFGQNRTASVSVNIRALFGTPDLQFLPAAASVKMLVLSASYLMNSPKRFGLPSAFAICGLPVHYEYIRPSTEEC
jgi:hypothetical protein